MSIKDFSTEKYDIIIQAGQSNADGTSYGNVDAPYVPSNRVWYINKEFYLEWAQEQVSGNDIRSNFGPPFAQKYMDAGLLSPDRKLLIVRAAWGGTGFLDNHWKCEDHLYKFMIQQIETALSLNPENRLVALLWHQGESDAVCHASHDVHYKHLEAFLTSVRSRFQVPDLPFIAGDFVQHWKESNREICEPVVNAMRDFCRNTDFAAFVETDGLSSNDQDHGGGDTIHFSRKALYELAYRYFDAYQSIRK